MRLDVDEDVPAEALEGATPLTFEFYRPNWKSLQSPGVLPLTTDYCPDRAELDYNYTENFYTLTLPEEVRIDEKVVVSNFLCTARRLWICRL